MQEYLSRAIVLDKEGRSKDADARYSLFTERYGKIAATATSSRKITSKLAGHLEPGTLAAIRIVEQRGTRLVDALAERHFSGEQAEQKKSPSLADLAALNRILPEWQPEEELWKMVSGTIFSAAEKMVPDTIFSWSRVLAILGWDPRGAVCAQCSTTTHANAPQAARPIRHFYIPRQEFFCTPCAAHFMHNQLLLIDG